jgi:hypothetical protein
MLALVAVELAPATLKGPSRGRGALGALAGGALMLALALLLQP